MRKIAGVMCAVIALALVGCSSEDNGGDSKGSGARTPPGIPSLASVRWQTDGGSALGHPGFSGGQAGSISVFTGFGSVARYSGQSLPTPAVNLLASAGTTITYTQLLALLTPTIAGTTATFDLPPDTGFRLPAGSTLDLSDAGVGVIDAVEITSDQPIRIDGTIVTARTSDDSVDLALVHNGGTELGLMVTGAINASGASQRDGGDVALISLSSVVLTGTVDCRGGAANSVAMTNGRDGGGLNILAQFGDVLHAAGAFSARGGAAEGNGNGGSGGSISVISFGNDDRDFHAHVLSSGGAAVDGTAGQATAINIEWSGTGSAFVYADASGGSTTGTGAANDAGVITLGAQNTTFKGAALLLSNGGSSATGSGRHGGSITVVARNFELARIHARCNGGSGISGGFGSQITLPITGPQGSQVLDVVLDLEADGGDGTTSGGDGGGILCFSGSAVSGRFVEIDASSTGGDGATAGNGAGTNPTDIAFGTLHDAEITIDTSGGDGATAGNAGNSQFQAVTGSKISLALTAVGGDGADAGNGGVSNVSFVSLTGFRHTVTSSGGVGTTTTGGNAGGVTLSGVSSNCLLAGNLSYTMHGGEATTGSGGNAGSTFITLAGGRFVGSLNVLADGGSATAGTGGGGFGGSLFLDYGTFEGSLDVSMSGGNSVGGAGGSCQLANFTAASINASASRFSRFELTGIGGSSESGNGGSGATVQWSVPGGLDLTGDVHVSGGDGSVVSGNGTGGSGGFVTFTANPSNLNLNLDLISRGGSSRGNGDAGSGGGQIYSGGQMRLRGSYDVGGGDVLGSGSGSGGSAGTLNFTSTFDLHASGTFVGVGGSAIAGDQGGQGSFLTLNSNQGKITSTANYTLSGGAGNTGNGGTAGIFLLVSAQGALTVSGQITAIGGDSAGGNGGPAPGVLVSNCASLAWTANYTGRGGNSVTGQGGGAGSVSMSVGAGGGTLGGTLLLNGGNAGTTMDGGSTSGFGISSAGTLFTISAQLTSNGGTSAAGTGGSSTGFFLSGSADLVVSGQVRVHGGASTTGTGGNAGNVNISGSGDFTLSGTIEGFGGSGATGADGPSFNFGNDSSATVTLTSGARVRANAGTPAGMPGLIILDPTGTGGLANPNLVEQTGRVLETLNGAGTNTNNVTRD